MNSENHWPLVSIIIPIYNSENYIIDTLESCTSQTYKNIEVIVVDDGSKDKSYSTVANFISTHPQIKLMKQKNGGASRARNLGLKHSNGDYVMYLDADDFMTKNKIENQIKKLHKINDPFAVAICAYEEFTDDEPTNIIQNRFYYHDNLSPRDLLIDIWSQGAMIPISCYLISKSMVSIIGDWDERLSLNDDGDYFSRVLMKASKVYFVEDCCFFYRRGHNSLSTTDIYSEAKLTSLLLSYKKQKSILELEDNLKIRNALARNFSIVLNSAKYGSKLYNEALAEIKALGQKAQIINPSSFVVFFVNLFGTELYLRIKNWIK